MSSRSENTRRRILEAAWARFEAGDPAHLEGVAADAGVSRQAVYLHFGSRVGLLLALVDHIDVELGLYAKLEAIRALPDPWERLYASLGLTVAYAPRIHTLGLALYRMAATEEDARVAYEDRMDLRRAGLREILATLEARDELREGFSVDEIVDVLVDAGAPATWESLVVGRGWSPARFEAWMLHLAASFRR